MRELKAVYFNPQTEAQLLQYAHGLDNFSGWVKDRIRERSDPAAQISPAIKEYIEDLFRKQITIFEVLE